MNPMQKPDSSPMAPSAAEPGEHFNVRLVHGALWREWNEPTERKSRLPWYLRIFYFGMFMWGFAYLATYGGNWRWDEYEHRIGARARRRLEKRAVEVNKDPARLPVPARP